MVKVSAPLCAHRALVALLGAGDAESAAVLTPYNGQVRLIRSILKTNANDLLNKARPPFPYWSPLLAQGSVVQGGMCHIMPGSSQHAQKEHDLTREPGCYGNDVVL